MSNSAERLKQALLMVLAILQAIGGLWLALGQGAEKITAFFERLMFPLPVASALGWAIPSAAAIVCFILLRRAALTRSKLQDPDRFELRPHSRQQLKGREQDIRDLLSLLAEHRLLFLIGESGSGKSTLIETGLIPDLEREARTFPILIRRYGSSWDAGPLKEVWFAVTSRLSPDQGAKVSIGHRPQTVTELHALFLAIGAQLGRQPLLIFDQFDDHLLAHRTSFTTGQGAWKDARTLQAQSAFWNLVATCLTQQVIQCLFVTRSDAAAGLDCVRFLSGNEAATRDLLRLKVEYLEPLLDELAPLTANPPIVRDPEQGWVQLKSSIARELQQSGGVLPQQVRTLSLGLRALPYLTLREYRRNGSAPGIEAMYVGRAIADCAVRSRTNPTTVRALLRSMVVSSENEADLKTIARDLRNLSEIVADENILRAVLGELSKLEIVRRVWNSEDGIDEWQLDHDYLARAVRTEERLSNKAAVMLRESAASWRAAVGDWQARWRVLLPVRAQLELLRERLSPKSSFRYGSDGRYALTSLVRVVPHLLVMLTIGVIYWWSSLNSQINAILDENRGQSFNLWNLDAAKRSRLIELLVSNRNKRGGVYSGWPQPMLGLDPQRIADVSKRVLVEQKTFDYSDFAILRTLHPYLEVPMLESLAERLIALSFDEQSPIDTEDSIAVLAELSPQLNEVSAQRIAAVSIEKLKAVLAKTPEEFDVSISLSQTNDCDALAELFEQAGTATVRRQAIDLVDPHVTSQDYLYFAAGCLRLYARVAVALQGANFDIKSHRESLGNLVEEAREPYQDGRMNRDYFIPALLALAIMDATQADEVASRIYIASLGKFKSDCLGREKECEDRNSALTFSELGIQVRDLSGAFSPATTMRIAGDLTAIYRDIAKRSGESKDYQQTVLFSLKDIAPELDRQGAEALLQDLGTAIHSDEELGLSSDGSLFHEFLETSANGTAWELLSQLAPNLSMQSADATVQGIDMAVTSYPYHHDYRYLDMLGKFGPHLSPVAAGKVARLLVANVRGEEPGMLRDHQVRALSHLVYGLAGPELVEVAKLAVEGLASGESTGDDALASMAQLAGRSCERMAQAGLHRRAGIECMLLSVLAPRTTSVDEGVYSWREIQKFAGLPEVTALTDVMQWAQKKENIVLGSIQPRIVRSRFQSLPRS